VEPIYSDHARLDERSLALHRLVAKKVLADPTLLDRARANLRRWQASHGSHSFALAEWDQILTNPVDQVAAFLVERSERATRLRQSSPFTGILTEAERAAIYEPKSGSWVIVPTRRTGGFGWDRREHDRVDPSPCG
jgi:hypothetical protein